MRTIGFALPPGFQIMGLAPASAFEMANVVAREPLYDIRLLSESGGPLRNSFGVPVETRALARHRPDTLIVAGLVHPQPSSPGLIRQIHKALDHSRRVASVCTGAFMLGEAGLLDGRRVTTHWFHARVLRFGRHYVRLVEQNPPAGRMSV